MPIMTWVYAKALLLVGRDAVAGAKVGAIRAGALFAIRMGPGKRAAIMTLAGRSGRH